MVRCLSQLGGVFVAYHPLSFEILSVVLLESLY